MIARDYRVRFEHLRCALAQRVGLDVNLLSSAVAVDEMHPAEIVAGPPCIALPGQYERVRSAPYGLDVKKEIAELQGAPRRIEPTLRYVLDDVLVSHSTIYRHGRVKFFNQELRDKQAGLPWAEHHEVRLRSSYVGCHFFGHWLRDDCATHLLAEQAGVPMSMPTPAWPDRAGYLKVFGQCYGELGQAHVRRLVLFDDINQNANKAERLRILRARLAKGQSFSSTGRIIYLSRGPGGKQRALLNESEIIDAITRRGVAVVQAELLAVPDFISELFAARIVISVEGSQLSHAVYTLQEQGGVLAILEPHRFINPHMDWARALGMRYGIIVGEQRATELYLPIDDLLRTIDMLDAQLP